MPTDPDKAPADGQGSPSNSPGLKSGELLAALAVNPLNGAIALIEDPDRPLPCHECLWSRPQFSSRYNLIGSWINAV